MSITPVQTWAAAPTLRVLVYGHVNANVVDGSAFWLSSAASMLASLPGVAVDIVTANPIRRPVVLAEALGTTGVQVFDPYHDRAFDDGMRPWREKAVLTPQEAADVVASYWDRREYDALLVRSTEVAAEIAERRADLAPHLLAYVTGVPFADEPVKGDVAVSLSTLGDRGATLVFQTPEMRDHVLAGVPGADAWPMTIMSPAVPTAAPGDPVGSGEGVVLAYTGKFARGWNTLEMLAGFKEAHREDDRLRLVVAGDHFIKDPDRHTFVREATSLLRSSGGIEWLGGISRARAQGLIRAADVGLSWRSPRLSASLELSTKSLEYGILGRPTILNRTPMHERLLGADYPLFVESMPQYVDLLLELARDGAVLRTAAGQAAAAAQDYTYARVAERLVPVLLGVSRRKPLESITWPVGRLPPAGADRETRLVRDGAGASLVSWLTTPSDAAAVFAATGGARGVQWMRHLGPLVAVGMTNDAPSAGASTGESADFELLAALSTAAASGWADSSQSDGVAVGPELEVAHDVDGRLSLVPAVPPTDTVAAADLVRARSQLKGAEAREAQTRRRYEALASSQLGRVQVRYWRLLAAVRARSRGARR